MGQGIRIAAREVEQGVDKEYADAGGQKKWERAAVSAANPSPQRRELLLLWGTLHILQQGEFSSGQVDGRVGSGEIDGWQGMPKRLWYIFKENFFSWISQYNFFPVISTVFFFKDLSSLFLFYFLLQRFIFCSLFSISTYLPSLWVKVVPFFCCS